MKKYIKLVTSALVFASMLFTTSIAPSFAQEIQEAGGGGGGGGGATLLPVYSQDALRNYALSIVTNGSRYVHSESMDWNWSDRITYTNVFGAYAEDVLEKLFASEFRYRLTNPEDLIRGYVYLYDSKNNLLFFGYAEYTAETLKKEKPQYNIWMQNVPLLSGVESAEVLALDEDGHTARRYPLQVNNGQVMFQSWMAGSPNGILVVRFTDGTVNTFNLSQPSGETPSSTSEVAAYKVDGHYILKIPAFAEKPAVLKILELWTRPTAFLELGAKNTVTIDVMGLVQQDGKTLFERPKSMEVMDIGSGQRWNIELSTEQPTPLTFIAGKYRIRFNWVNFGKPNMLYTGPDGGGKG